METRLPQLMPPSSVSRPAPLAWMLAGLGLLLGCRAPNAAPAPNTSGGASAKTGRIVVIGDLHGDLDQSLASLRLAGLVNEAGAWSGGDATLVQLGDMTNRGPDSRGVLALMRRLPAEAAAQGGRVITVLGNHEVMNMQGDWRYVSPQDYESYGGPEGRISSFLADGADGAWLRTLPTVAKLGDIVFVHGGVTPRWAELGLDGINDGVRAAIEVRGAPILGEDSPLWYRGYVDDNAGLTCADLDQALARLGAKRMIVGHTRTKDNRIQWRCAGKLIAADISISGVYGGGHLGVVELVDGDARALYPGETEDLPDP